MPHLSIESLNTLFLEARTHSVWQSKEVSDALIQEIYNLAKMGPTSANCCPLRVIFVKSHEAKARLKPCLAEGNIEKTMTAPVTAIMAYDLHFYDHFTTLFPHADAKSWFTGSDALIQETAFRNATLQAAYFILAARAKGLDCGPMSGFDAEKINQTFFADQQNVRVHLLCNLGYGVPESLHPRLPRFPFSDVCSVQ